MKKNICPVCRYFLPFKPWIDRVPAHEMCPQCGIQFGYLYKNCKKVSNLLLGSDLLPFNSKLQTDTKVFFTT